MTKRATLTDVATGYNSAVTLNENFHSLNERFDNTLSLDGSTPNALKADLDLNYNDLLNVNLFDTKELRINGEKVTSITTVPYWAGGWEPQTTYAKNVLVRESGNSYISLEEHTSSLSFSNDLSAGRWELFASRGSAGAGTGDMLASANLSDLDDVSIARNNLGLGTMATEDASDYTLVANLGPLATGDKESHRVSNPANTNNIPWLWSGSDIRAAFDSYTGGGGTIGTGDLSNTVAGDTFSQWFFETGSLNLTGGTTEQVSKKMVIVPGTLRVKGEWRRGQGNVVGVRIRKNDNVVWDSGNGSTNVWQAFSEDIVVALGDRVEVGIRAAASSPTDVRNLGVFYSQAGFGVVPYS